MAINIAIHKAFISRDLVNKLLIAKMSLENKMSLKNFNILQSVRK